MQSIHFLNRSLIVNRYIDSKNNYLMEPEQNYVSKRQFPFDGLDFSIFVGYIEKFEIRKTTYFKNR